MVLEASAAPVSAASPSIVARWLVAWLGAGVALALTETLLVSGMVSDSISATTRWTVLPLLLTGNVLGYVAPLALAFALADFGFRRLSVRRRGRVLFGSIVAVACLPYAFYISHFTFSGPRVLDLWYRPLLIACATLACLGLGVSSFTLAAWRPSRVGWRWAVGLGALVVAVVCLSISAAVLPNEYEPLHAFLMLAAMLSATLGVGHLAAAVRPIPKLALGSALTVGVGWAAASTWFLTDAHHYAWVIWGGTPGSRYLTQRLVLDDVDDERDGADERSDLLVDRPPKGWAKGQRWNTFRQLRRKEAAPNVIVFSIDNLQVDHVGAYGYRRHPTTPNIDRIARRGVLFERAYSFYPQTRVFMSSMLLGRKVPAFGRHHVPEDYRRTALTRLLKERDYLVLVKGVFELTAYREFNPKHYAIDTWLRRATSAEIRAAGTIPHIPLAERFAQIQQHLERAAREDRPVFMWMHFLQPHRWGSSFVASDDFPFGEDREDRYDSAVAATDHLIPKLESMLAEQLGSKRPTVWIVQSDHGAGLRQGKDEKGKNLLDDHVHVPLIIAAPGMAPGVVDVPVDSSVDTAATVLDLVGIEPPASYDGASLVPLLVDRGMQSGLARRAIVLQQGGWQGAVWGGWKLVSYRGAVSLFDIDSDPFERKNLAGSHADVVRRLRKPVARRLKGIRREFERRRDESKQRGKRSKREAERKGR